MHVFTCSVLYLPIPRSRTWDRPVSCNTAEIWTEMCRHKEPGKHHYNLSETNGQRVHARLFKQHHWCEVSSENIGFGNRQASPAAFTPPADMGKETPPQMSLLWWDEKSRWSHWCRLYFLSYSPFLRCMVLITKWWTWMPWKKKQKQKKGKPDWSL